MFSVYKVYMFIYITELEFLFFVIIVLKETNNLET